MPTLTFQQPTFPRTRTAASSTQSAALGTPLSLKQRMVQHVFEPELLRGYPRLVKRRESPWAMLKYTFLWVIMGLQTFSSLSHLHDHPEYFWMFGSCFLGLTILNLVMLYAWVSQRKERVKERQEYQLLRYGIPAAAVVLDTQKTGENCQVEFLYTDRFGDVQTRTTEMTWDAAQKRGYHSGKIFTVLTSRENDAVLPYPSSDTFTVISVAPTAVTQKVSANIQAHLANIPVQTSSIHGLIEPELLTSPPRTVRLRWQEVHIFLLKVAVLSAIAAIVPWLFPDPKWKFILFFFTGPTIIGDLISFARAPYRGTGRLLRVGIPARAIVTSASPTAETASYPDAVQNVLFTYRFESADGTLYSGHLYKNRAKAWAIDLYEGSTFTVLYDPQKPSESIPYFATATVSDVEISGVMAASITPPTKGQP